MKNRHSYPMAISLMFTLVMSACQRTATANVIFFLQDNPNQCLSFESRFSVTKWGSDTSAGLHPWINQLKSSYALESQTCYSLRAGVMLLLNTTTLSVLPASQAWSLECCCSPSRSYSSGCALIDSISPKASSWYWFGLGETIEAWAKGRAKDPALEVVSAS